MIAIAERPPAERRALRPRRSRRLAGQELGGPGGEDVSGPHAAVEVEDEAAHVAQRAAGGAHGRGRILSRGRLARGAATGADPLKTWGAETGALEFEEP